MSCKPCSRLSLYSVLSHLLSPAPYVLNRITTNVTSSSAKDSARADGILDCTEQWKDGAQPRQANTPGMAFVALARKLEASQQLRFSS